MPLVKHNGLHAYHFEIFPSNLEAAIFTRMGGVSPEPWDTLNLGGTVGDRRDNVIENRRRIFNTIDRPIGSIFDVWQVHGNKIICAEEPRPLDEPHQKADGILTRSKDITLLMRFADCTPILLFDPVNNVMGIIHAGWQGTIKRIGALAINRMRSDFGSEPKNIIAGIGPSICVEHYEVGEEVCVKAREVFSGSQANIIQNINGRPHFDLIRANRITLEEAGVRSIQESGECTACHLDRWYSHRAEKGVTGRFGAVMFCR